AINEQGKAWRRMATEAPGIKSGGLFQIRSSPERGVRRWCRRSARLTDPELTEVVTYTKTSNKRWTHDQSGTVLEITVRDHSNLSLRFTGAADDPNYEIRLGIKREKAAARMRRYRAARSPGRRCGRPKSGGGPVRNVFGISRATYYRHKASGGTETRETKNPSRDISKNRKRRAISVSRLVPPPWTLLGMSRRTFVTA